MFLNHEFTVFLYCGLSLFLKDPFFQIIRMSNKDLYSND